MAITVDIIDAIKVQFKKPIFEDDFPEKGMTAWLTDVVWEDRANCYKLYFDFSDFEQENDKYFKHSYYSNLRTKDLELATGRTLFTAKEAGHYLPKYCAYFSCGDHETRSDAAFDSEIQDYLRVVE